MIKYILVFTAILYGGFSLEAQTQLVSTGGTADVTANGILSWSVGELAIMRTPTANGDLAEGFHHATLLVEENTTTALAEERLIDLKVFPNPTTSLLYISKPEINEDVQFMMHNLNGQLMASGKIPAGSLEATIDMQTSAAGTYVLVVSNRANGTSSSFKIIKSK